MKPKEKLLYLRLSVAVGVGCLLIPNLLSATFSVDSSFRPSPRGSIQTLAIQPDGKILIGGSFSQVGNIPQNGLARLLPNGTLDSTFQAHPGSGSLITSIAILPDGKILIGGKFSKINNFPVASLARLLPDGTLDETFDAEVDDLVQTLVVQPDGKILIGGWFHHINGSYQPYLARLKPNGQLDTSFQIQPDDVVRTFALQPDGKILIGGSFKTVNHSSYPYLVRVTSEGTLDHSFHPNPNGDIKNLVVQPDGQILVIGSFNQIGGGQRYWLARLKPNGTLDASFQPNPTIGVCCASLQADGKILIGGWFVAVDEQPRHCLARLFPDGSLDPNLHIDFSFPHPMSFPVLSCLTTQPDGNLLVGGRFDSVDQQPISRCARILSSEKFLDQIVCGKTNILWQWTGNLPAFWRTTLEISQDGQTWNLYRTGIATSQGWQFSCPTLPPGIWIRLHGFILGTAESSNWFVERIVRIPPRLTIWQTKDRKIHLHWTGPGQLQYAEQITGPWHNLSTTNTDYEEFHSSPQRFYRLKIE